MSEPKKYGCLLIDPAWRFKDTNARGAAEKHYKKDEKTQRATMTIEEIYALPVELLAAKDAQQFLWTTAAHQYHAHSLMALWGFEFKLAIPWVKTNDIETVIVHRPDNVDGPKIGIEHRLTANYLKKTKKKAWREAIEVQEDAAPPVSITIGNGHYFRHVHELCLFGARGSATAPETQRNIPNIIFAPLREHSEKPEILHQIIELISPTPRLEMFARKARAGWDVWGNEAPGSIQLPTRGG